MSPLQGNTAIELRDFFLQAPTPLVVLLGSEHRFALANPPYEALVGRKVEGKTVSEAFTPEEVGQFLPLLDHVYHTGQSYIGKEIPMTIEEPGKPTRDVFLNFGYHAFRAQDGTIRGVLAIVNDVTEQVEARKIIELSKSRVELETRNMRALFQETPEFFCILGGEDFRYEYVNPSHRLLFAGEDMTGKTVKDGQPELAGSPFLAMLGEVLRTGNSAFFHESRAQIRDEERFLDLIYAPRTNEMGQVDGILCLGSDRTERVRAREQLQNSERNLRAVADVMPQVVWTAQPDGILDSTNRRWVEYSGSSVPQDWHLFVHPDDRDLAFAAWGKCVTTGNEYEIEFRLRRFDGDYRWHLVRASALRSADGAIERWYGTCTDIQENKNAEVALRLAQQAAEDANSAKSAFLANMSHEIRTPLGAVMGFIGLMKNSKLSRESLAEYIAVIERNSGQLLRIIDDILDLSKVEAGKLLIEEIDFSLPEVLADFSSLMGFRARENGIALNLTALNDLPSIVRSDPTRLRQILANVIGNAIKFTERGSVSLEVHYTESMLTFRVIDTGVGISAEQARGLFQAFQQADISTTRRFGGTGLGLILTQRLSEAMGGKFYLESSNVGTGSVFVAQVRVNVPATAQMIPSAQVDFQQTLHPPVPTEAAPLTGLSVLVVDDSPDNRSLARILLTELGANVTLAQDGVEGLAIASPNANGTSHFDAVLMDVQMPRMDGHEATRRLRALGSRTPIIALTAHAMKEEWIRAKQSGFTDFLAKPIQRHALVNALKAIAPTARASQSDCDILIVEDDPDILELLTELLVDEGFRIRTAKDGREALASLDAGGWPPVLLIDLSLPGMDGSELIGQLNGRSERKQSKIIVASGWDDLTNIAKRLGADASIRKPYDASRLLDLLKR